MNVLEQALEALKRCTKFDQRDYDAMDALEAAIAHDTLKRQWQREALLEAAIVVGNMKGYDVEDIAGDLRIMAKELET